MPTTAEGLTLPPSLTRLAARTRWQVLVPEKWILGSPLGTRQLNRLQYDMTSGLFLSFFTLLISPSSRQSGIAKLGSASGLLPPVNFSVSKMHIHNSKFPSRSHKASNGYSLSLSLLAVGDLIHVLVWNWVAALAVLIVVLDSFTLALFCQELWTSKEQADTQASKKEKETEGGKRISFPFQNLGERLTQDGVFFFQDFG